MRIFKADYFRFFMFGFAVGTALVFTVLDNSMGSDLANEVVPVAEAAPAR